MPSYGGSRGNPYQSSRPNYNPYGGNKALNDDIYSSLHYQSTRNRHHAPQPPSTKSPNTNNPYLYNHYLRLIEENKQNQYSNFIYNRPDLSTTRLPPQQTEQEQCEEATTGWDFTAFGLLKSAWRKLVGTPSNKNTTSNRRESTANPTSKNRPLTAPIQRPNIAALDNDEMAAIPVAEEHQKRPNLHTCSSQTSANTNTTTTTDNNDEAKSDNTSGETDGGSTAVISIYNLLQKSKLARDDAAFLHSKIDQVTHDRYDGSLLYIGPLRGGTQKTDAVRMTSRYHKRNHAVHPRKRRDVFGQEGDRQRERKRKRLTSMRRKQPERPSAAQRNGFHFVAHGNTNNKEPEPAEIVVRENPILSVSSPENVHIEVDQDNKRKEVRSPLSAKKADNTINKITQKQTKNDDSDDDLRCKDDENVHKKIDPSTPNDELQPEQPSAVQRNGFHFKPHKNTNNKERIRIKSILTKVTPTQKNVANATDTRAEPAIESKEEPNKDKEDEEGSSDAKPAKKVPHLQRGLMERETRYLAAYTTRLTRIYTTYQPNKVDKVEGVIAKYGRFGADKLHDLYVAVCVKYELKPLYKYDGHAALPSKDEVEKRVKKTLPKTLNSNDDSPNPTTPSNGIKPTPNSCGSSTPARLETIDEIAPIAGIATGYAPKTEDETDDEDVYANKAIGEQLSDTFHAKSAQKFEKFQETRNYGLNPTQMTHSSTTNDTETRRIFAEREEQKVSELEKINKQIRGILNKMTADNFDKLSQEMARILNVADMALSELKGSTHHAVLSMKEALIKLILKCILERAMTDVIYMNQYARLVHSLSLCSEHKNEFDDLKKKLLRQQLLSLCNSIFNKARDAQDKVRFIGIVTMIGELYRFGLISWNVISSGIFNGLLPPQTPLDIEAVCKLLKTAGNEFDRQHYMEINVIIDQLSKCGQRYDFRTRCFVEEIQEIRGTQWKAEVKKPPSFAFDNPFASKPTDTPVAATFENFQIAPNFTFTNSAPPSSNMHIPFASTNNTPPPPPSQPSFSIPNNFSFSGSTNASQNKEKKTSEQTFSENNANGMDVCDNDSEFCFQPIFKPNETFFTL